MISCTHKTEKDHQFGLGENARPRWRCTYCKAVDVWRDGWGYWGSLECRSCGCGDITDVHCPECKSLFTERHAA